MITFQGFTYAWHEDSFLSRPQVEYALERLWVLTAGNAVWENLPIINFPAINRKQVDDMLELPPNAMSWIPLVQVLPKDTQYHLDTESLPAICLVDESTTIIYTGIGNYPLDLVAATFILLTRWEEWQYPELDQYGCHQEDAMLCVRQNFRERPVLDEWAMMLRPWLEKKEPSWSAVLPSPEISISHDIDHIIYYKNWLKIPRSVLRTLIHDRSISHVYTDIKEGISSLRTSSKDPTFRSIYDLISFDESVGLSSTFFFMSAQAGKFDDGYELDSVIVKNILKEIKNRGHNIGWHPGFSAADCDLKFKTELNKFIKSTGCLSVNIRHHYLRWQAGRSWERAADNSISSDSSLGYNYNVGFRASTAHPYPAYSFKYDSPLPLLVKPLILMDNFLINSTPEKISLAYQLKQRCQNVNGIYSILLHNRNIKINANLFDIFYKLIITEQKI